MMPAARWLLLLGSNLEHDLRVHDALTQLATLGRLERLTPIRRLPADNKRPGSFYNVLVRLDSGDANREHLDARLKHIELQLGRQRGHPQQVAIDIDILAHHDGTRWQSDPHAQAKGEFSRSAVRLLLCQAEIRI